MRVAPHIGIRNKRRRPPDHRAPGHLEPVTVPT
jgi:hypothetical protein